MTDSATLHELADDVLQLARSSDDMDFPSVVRHFLSTKVGGRIAAAGYSDVVADVERAAERTALQVILGHATPEEAAAWAKSAIAVAGLTLRNQAGPAGPE